METIKFLGLLAFTWLFVYGSAPIQFGKMLLGLTQESEIRNTWMKVLRKLVNCSLCSGFWIALLFYGLLGYNGFFLIACGFSICAEIFSRLVNLILSTLR